MFSRINPKLIFNALGFQIVWFICVQGNNSFAVFSTIALILCHQLIFNTRLKNWSILIAFSSLGYLGDSLLARVFYLDYSDNFGDLAPLWLLSLWLCFSTTINHSMAWLFKTPYFSVLAGLFLVPLSYWAGIKLSGSSFTGSENPNTYWLFFIFEGIWWAALLLTYQRFSESNRDRHA